MRKTPARPRVTPAAASDAAALAELHNMVADHLTRAHGRGHWSSCTTERGVRWAMKISRIFVARQRGKILAAFTLATRKPWAIDVSYFTPVGKALYLLNLAVDPRAQGRGLGRRMIAAVIEEARAWPAEAIRLDAYDTAAGAGQFYVSCGFRERGRMKYKGTQLRYFEMLL